MTANFKAWTSRILLAFVFVTIGFALGRETAPVPSASTGEEQAQVQAQPAADDDKVVVYSAHMTFRCWECNQIEHLTKELLEKEFAREQAAGLIEYRSVDYMKDSDFAKRYNIASSTVVLVRIEDGHEADFVRLDEVWTKARKREEFLSYVGGAIRSQLDQLDKEEA
ncbi:MAG: nitrophenyl compound nitroreductase subunit ArsF family protein [Planctomycetota bacterium]